ncbi:unnamed protein product [Arctogadus glacialis]
MGALCAGVKRGFDTGLVPEGRVENGPFTVVGVIDLKTRKFSSFGNTLRREQNKRPAAGGRHADIPSRIFIIFSTTISLSHHAPPTDHLRERAAPVASFRPYLHLSRSRLLLIRVLTAPPTSTLLTSFADA